MWWTIDAAHRVEFEDWHAHEHFPERLSIPGFNRGSRWSVVADSGEVFVIYELDRYETLTSPDYRARLCNVMRDLPSAKAITGAHLLKTDTPDAAPTTEQKIRGNDAAADWIVVLAGYDLAVLEATCEKMLSAASLGLESPARGDIFRLAYVLAKTDL